MLDRPRRDDGIKLAQLLVGEAGMAHDEVERAGRDQEAQQIGAEIPLRIEGGDAGETAIDVELAAQRRAAEAGGVRREGAGEREWRNSP